MPSGGTHPSEPESQQKVHPPAARIKALPRTATSSTSARASLCYLGLRLAAQSPTTSAPGKFTQIFGQEYSRRRHPSARPRSKCTCRIGGGRRRAAWSAQGGQNDGFCWCRGADCSVVVVHLAFGGTPAGIDGRFLSACPSDPRLAGPQAAGRPSGGLTEKDLQKIPAYQAYIPVDRGSSATATGAAEAGDAELEPVEPIRRGAKDNDCEGPRDEPEASHPGTDPGSVRREPRRRLAPGRLRPREARHRGLRPRCMTPGQGLRMEVVSRRAAHGLRPHASSWPRAIGPHWPARP
jgi:hypothetical protein